MKKIMGFTLGLTIGVIMCMLILAIFEYEYWPAGFVMLICTFVIQTTIGVLIVLKAKNKN